MTPRSMQTMLLLGAVVCAYASYALGGGAFARTAPRHTALQTINKVDDSALQLRGNHFYSTSTGIAPAAVSSPNAAAGTSATAVAQTAGGSTAGTMLLCSTDLNAEAEAMFLIGDRLTFAKAGDVVGGYVVRAIAEGAVQMDSGDVITQSATGCNATAPVVTEGLPSPAPGVRSIAAPPDTIQSVPQRALNYAAPNSVPNPEPLGAQNGPQSLPVLQNQPLPTPSAPGTENNTIYGQPAPSPDHPNYYPPLPRSTP